MAPTEEEWKCKDCKTTNFLRRDRCRKCGGKKPPTQENGRSGRAAKGNRKGEGRGSTEIAELKAKVDRLVEALSKKPPSTASPPTPPSTEPAPATTDQAAERAKTIDKLVSAIAVFKGTGCDTTESETKLEELRKQQAAEKPATSQHMAAWNKLQKATRAKETAEARLSEIGAAMQALLEEQKDLQGKIAQFQVDIEARRSELRECVHVTAPPPAGAEGIKEAFVRSSGLQLPDGAEKIPEWEPYMAAHRALVEKIKQSQPRDPAEPSPPREAAAAAATGEGDMEVDVSDDLLGALKGALGGDDADAAKKRVGEIFAAEQAKRRKPNGGTAAGGNTEHS